MQARFYLPGWGRFASPDPARDQHFEQTQSWNIYSYVQNMPTIAVDPNGMELIIKGNMRDEFKKAVAYLGKSKSAGSLIKMLKMYEGSKTKNLVVWSDSRIGENTSLGGEVRWNPTLGNALQTGNAKDSPFTGEVQSPAIGLAHELSHEEKKQSGQPVDRSPDAKYENKEEKRATEKESKIANELGEPTRENHGGTDVRVKDSTSREPVDPGVKKRLEDARTREESK